MKGLQKAVMRTPHMLTSKVGMTKKSSDAEFDEYNRSFTALEGAAEQFLKDTKAYTDAVNSLLTSGQQFSTHFANLFSPFPSEYGLESKHPDAAITIRSIDQYQREMEELKVTLSPELELVESRIVQPIRELQNIMKAIRKNITKRDHKLIDYDRFNNSLTKLRDKKDKSLSDEKNLFKLEQDFEQAVTEYETYNNALKADLPQFMRLATAFIDPLFDSFYYMQLNIYYLMLEKMQAFCEKKYETGGTLQDVVATYEEKRGDVRERIEAFSITRRYTSTSRLTSQGRSGGLGSPTTSGLGRSASSASSFQSSTLGAGGVSRSATSASNGSILGTSKFGSLGAKKAPPPPPSANENFTAPPPYTASSSGSITTASAIAAKKAPPPPPVKPKPAPAQPAVVYVTALYDFEAQADGDLSFKAGDKIEIVQRSESTEDWWTGKLNGQQGVFPGNYVQD